MLSPTLICSNRHPRPHLISIKWVLSRVWAGESQVVPGRTNERIESVGLSLRRLSTVRTFRVQEARVFSEWGTTISIETDLVGEPNGQFVLGHGHRSTIIAVDDRNWRAPVALARNQPVAKVIRDGTCAPTVGFDLVGNRFFAIDARHTVELAGIDLRAGRNPCCFKLAAIPIGWRNYDSNFEVILLRKYEITLIVGWDAHTAPVPYDART